MRQIIVSAFDDLWLVSRYVAVGFFAVVLNIGLLYFFAETVGLWYLAAAVVAFIVTFIVAFLLQKHFTFRDGSGAYKRQGLMYFTIGVLNLAIDTALLYVAVDILGFWYLGSQIVIMGLMAGVSFVANRRITFGAHHTSYVRE